MASRKVKWSAKKGRRARTRDKLNLPNLFVAMWYKSGMPFALSDLDDDPDYNAKYGLRGKFEWIDNG